MVKLTISHMHEKLCDEKYIRDIHLEKPLLKRLTKKFGFGDQNDSTEQDETLDKNIYEWLGSLRILSGVPFNYLVPDEQMLPVESIRFFYVDANWINHLLDGACSLARNTVVDKLHDQTYQEIVAQGALEASFKKRNNQFDSSDEKKEMSGFLLRSSIVSDYPGLEVKAYRNSKSTPESELSLLRMDKLSENVWIAIFAGCIHHVSFIEPAENLYSGFTFDKKKSCYVKKLRRLVPEGKEKAGSEIKGKSISIEEKPINNRAEGVMPIFEIANQLKKQLHPEKELNSAEFAFEMMTLADIVTFTNE